MKAITLAAMVAATAGAAEARNGCMDFLSQELRIAGMIDSDDVAWGWRNRLDGAPEDLAAEVDEVIRLAEARRSAHRALTAALMRLCAAYPDD